jgi:hypothetical protein
MMLMGAAEGNEINLEPQVKTKFIEDMSKKELAETLKIKTGVNYFFSNKDYFTIWFIKFRKYLLHECFFVMFEKN